MTKKRKRNKDNAISDLMHTLIKGTHIDEYDRDWWETFAKLTLKEIDNLHAMVVHSIASHGGSWKSRY